MKQYYFPFFPSISIVPVNHNQITVMERGTPLTYKTEIHNRG